MQVTITGAAGFIGRKLARRLLESNALAGSDGTMRQLERMILLDMAPPDDATANDPRVTVLTGDMRDRSLLEQALPAGTDSVFHLAAVVSAGAEEDFDLGMAVNLDATRTILEICRGHSTRPRVVFASSCAAFGGEMPEPIADMTARTPQTSYGTQKVIGELLVNDYSRKQFVDGRAVRFPTVVVRPGKPNKAASTFASSIIREPLQGQRATCPVAARSRMFLASPRSIIENLLRAHNLAESDWGPSREVTFPGFTLSVGEMVDALKAVAGNEIAGRIDWSADPFIQAIVDGWPPEFDTDKADALGLVRDDSMEDVIRAFIEDDLDAAPPA
ncbi:MAG: SDR family oxidoreductase [Alphaproteobacteria bacterium]|nr:SDR family oxidoreductase [Alphaproteobacteria bacterium]